MSDCYVYLPVNPLCKTTDPCFDPCKNPYSCSDKLAYKGPDLPCTGIKNCDTLSVALQKIEAKMCEIIAILPTTTSTTTVV